MSIRELIATAIRDADKNYVFEDYGKQADAVRRALRDQGFVIMPAQLTNEMIEAGTEAIKKGKTKPSDHVRAVYAAILSKVKF